MRAECVEVTRVEFESATGHQETTGHPTWGQADQPVV
jgi:hypothetical protein